MTAGMAVGVVAVAVVVVVVVELEAEAVATAVVQIDSSVEAGIGVGLCFEVTNNCAAVGAAVEDTGAGTEKFVELGTVRAETEKQDSFPAAAEEMTDNC